MAIKGSDLYKDDGALDKLIEDLEKIKREYKSLLDIIKKESNSNIESLKLVPYGNSKGQNVIDKFGAETNKLAKKQEELTFALSEQNKQIQLLQKKKLEANRVAKLEAQLASSAAGSYNKLSAQYSLNKIELNAMSAAERTNTKEGQKLERQTREIYQEMKRLQEVTGKYTLDVGNYNKAASGLFGTLKRLAGIYLSFEGARRLGDVIFRQTKETDSLNTMTKNLIPNLEEQAQVNEYLTKTAEDNGVNLNVLTKAYLKYDAATKTSTLSLKQRQAVFSSIAKASAANNLSTAEQERVFKALEQMMSKGKVTAEELRQQLADSLPGAVPIMAKALGVGTAELDKMLEKGEVLADVALPKFAKELERAYGIENVDRIENVASAQGRFETSIIKTVEKLKAAKPIEDFFNLMAKGVTYIGDNIKYLGNLVKVITNVAVAYGAFRAAKTLANLAQKEGIATTVAEVSAKNLLTLANKRAASSYKSLAAAMALNPFGIALTIVTSLVTTMVLFNEELTDMVGLTTKVSRATREAKVEFEKEKIEIDQLFTAVKNTNIAYSSRQEALDKLKEKYPEYLEKLSLEKSSLEDLETAQRAVNKEILRNIVARQKQTFNDGINEQIASLQVKLTDLEIRGRDALTFWEKMNLVGSGRNDVAVRIRQITDELQNLREEQFEGNQAFDKLLNPFNIPRGGRDGIRDLFNRRNADKTNPSTGTGSGDDKKKKLYSEVDEFDPFKQEEIRLEALEDGLQKELAMLDAGQKRRAALFVRNGLLGIDFTELNQKERLKVIEKYQKIEAQKYAEAAKKQLEVSKVNYETGLSQLEQQEQLEVIKARLADKSEEEISKIILKHKKIRLQYELDYNTQLNALQKEYLRKQIELVDKELGNQTRKRSIWDLLGLTMDDNQIAAMKSAFDFAKNQVLELFQLRKDLAQQALDLANQDIASAERRLDAEMRARDLNHAHQVETTKQELALAKQRQKEALKDRREAQKAELNLQTALQTSNLITTATEIWKTLKLPFLAIPAIGLMFGSFVAAKTKAYQLTKEQRAEGGLDIIGGGSHASGNDTYLGYSVNGKPVYGERREAHMIITPRMTAKYKDKLPSLEKALNGGYFEKMLQPQFNSSMILGEIPVYENNQTDTSGMEGFLGRIATANEKLLKNSEEQVFYNKDGKRIVRYKGTEYEYI